MQVETLPQSMVDVKTIVLKPRLDRNDVRSIGENLKPQLFSKFGFKPKPEDIKLLASEQYFEPYLIIGGKYVLDYCKKHVIEAEVDQKTNKVFIAGQEFNSKETDPKTKRRVLELAGEEHAHHEKEGYYILDRMKREVAPEKLSLSPFVVIEQNYELNYSFKRMHLSDDAQIDFLRAKIAQRPTDVAEIIKEIFDITDRTIANYPMYLLTFENTKKRKELTVTIDGITGETVPNGVRPVDFKSIQSSREVLESPIWEPTFRKVQNELQANPIPDIASTVAKEEMEASPREEITVESQPSQPVVCFEHQAETAVEAVSTASKDVNKVGLKENQVTITAANQPTFRELVLAEPVAKVAPPVTKNNVEVSQEDNNFSEPKLTEPVVRDDTERERQIEPTPNVVPSVTKTEVSESPKEGQRSEYQPHQGVCGEDQAKAAFEAITRALTFMRAIEPSVGEKIRTEPAPIVVPPDAKNNAEVAQKNSEIAEPKLVESEVCKEAHAETIPPIKKSENLETLSKDDQKVQPPQPEVTTSLEQEQEKDKVYILPPKTTDNTLNVPEEVTTKSTQPNDNEPSILGFPAKILGEVVEIDDNAAVINGDLEIPSGTNITKNLAVLGSLKIGDNCRGHGKLKAHKDVTIGADTIIDGDVTSGGNIFVGPRSLINGIVEAMGAFEIEKDAIIEAVCAQSLSSQ